MQRIEEFLYCHLKKLIGINNMKICGLFGEN